MLTSFVRDIEPFIWLWASLNWESFSQKPEDVFAEDTTKDASWPEDILGAGGKPPQIMIEWQSTTKTRGLDA